MFTFVLGTHADADDGIVRNKNNDRDNTRSRANRWVFIIWSEDVIGRDSNSIELDRERVATFGDYNGR